VLEGRHLQPSAGIIDSPSVKTTDRGGDHGFDSAKKVNGRKRHILVDTLGLESTKNWGHRGIPGRIGPCFLTYIRNNRHLIPNYGERYRNGEAIATGFVESTVNQVVSKRFCKKQQMQWSKRGVHLLLQTRVKTLNCELGAVFKRWYPDLEVEELPAAA
jgi:hypothetical protein